MNEKKTPEDNLGPYDYERSRFIFEKDQEEMRAHSKQWQGLTKYLNFYFFKNKDKKTKNILDVGCGTGRYFPYFVCENLYGVDMSKDMLKFAQKTDDILKKRNNRKYDNLTLLQEDILQLSQQEMYQRKFDFIFSAHTLYVGMKSLNIFDFLDKINNVAAKGAKVVLDINTTGDPHVNAKIINLMFSKNSKQSIRNLEILVGDDALVISKTDYMFSTHVYTKKAPVNMHITVIYETV